MGVFEAALAALRIRRPLASLEIHVEQLTATEHGDLWLSQLGIWSVYLGHGESLQHGQDGGERRKKRHVNNTEHWQLDRSFVHTLIKDYCESKQSGCEGGIS